MNTILYLSKMHMAFLVFIFIFTSISESQEMQCVVAKRTSTYERSPKIVIDMENDGELEKLNISDEHRELLSGWLQQDGDVAPGTFVTGGGCHIPAFFGHNPPIIVNRPTDNLKGWVCQGADPPNIPLSFQVTVTAIICRIVPPDSGE